MQIKTPHIVAEEGSFKKTVLMPGDPLRVKYIAENFLKNAVEIQNIRGMLAYTGEYDGINISVMGSGMGVPSMGIYSYELYEFCGVENIIRIGTAGAIREDVKLRDIIISMGACTDSNYISQYGLNGSYSAIASFKLLQNAIDIAKENNQRIKVGNILSTESFYNANQENYKKWADFGVMAVEMEAAALYINAAKLKKNALTICTISDEVFTGNKCTAEERQNSLNEMITLGLKTAVKASV